MSLSAPAKPPVSAASALQKTSSIPATKKISLPGFKPPKLNKKIILIILAPIIIIIIGIASFQFINSPKNPGQLPTAPTPNPSATASATLSPTPFIIPGVPTGIPSPSDPNWSRLISEQSGLFYDYPSSFNLKESTDLYHTLHPTWYDTEHYFDCINRQVGTRFPFPCWLLTIQLTTADQQHLSQSIPSHLSDFSANHQIYRDGLNRDWQISGPLETQNTQIYLAETEINQVLYQLETQIISRSLDQYLRTHPNRPFAQNISDTDPTSLQQAHLNLLHQQLNTFNTYRKPFIPEPDWLRHRFNDNWSIAYPGTWLIFTPDDENTPPYISFSPQDDGRIQGWYGNGNFVGFHHYSITLTTPDLSQAPPSSAQNVDKWIEYALSQYPAEVRDQIEIIGIPKRRGRRNQKSVEFETRTFLNATQNQPPITDSLINNPAHQTYIWEFEGLPPRIVTIRQLDGLYEPKPMQQILDTFVKRIYE